MVSRPSAIPQPQRLSVMHVIDSLGIGGSERQLAAFLLRSDAGRFRHTVCALVDAGPLAAELREAGIPVHTLGVASEKDFIRSVVRLRKLVHEVRPDVLHSALFWSDMVARVVGWLSGKPVVTTLVNTTYEPEWRLENARLSRWKVWGTQMLESLTARWWGAMFVAVNESVKASAVRQLGLDPDRIAVIPRGLVLDRAHDVRDAHGTRAALGLDGAYPIILNVGRLVPQKGQQYAIQAMQHVVERFPTARLVIAGEGWLRPTLEQLIRSLELEDHVLLLGERDDIDSLLEMADIFVFPSLYEGAANAVLEAMSVGKPCVASRIPSICEVSGDETLALLTDLRSPDSIAGKIIRLAEDSTFANALGKAAREWVREHYDMRASVTALEAFYEGLRNGAPRQ